MPFLVAFDGGKMIPDRLKYLNIFLGLSLAPVVGDLPLRPEIVNADEVDGQKSEAENIYTLGDHLREIRPLEAKLRKVVENNDLFAGFKKLTADERLEDFDMYFPIYLAADFKYEIPWYLLWLMHTHETTVSRERWPEMNGYLGAMQRSSRYYPNSVVAEAIKGWEILDPLPQRYSKTRGFPTNDYEEIFFAAWKLRNDADQIRKNHPSLSYEESFLEALYSYSAPEFAAQRIRQYRYIQTILETQINSEPEEINVWVNEKE